jgi:hypothetical protein
MFVTDRNAISKEGDELLSGGLGDSFSGDADNNQLNAEIKSLIDQIGQNFLELISSGSTSEQPMSTLGTGSNNSNATNDVVNGDELMAPLSGIDSNTNTSSSLASV